MKREKDKLKVYVVQETFPGETVFAETGIKAGFPSPAQDYLHESINLNKVLISHPTSTFVVVAQRGMSNEECIEESYLLIIDRSLKPTGKEWAVYTIDGELSIRDSCPEEDSGYVYWGILTSSIIINRQHYLHALEYIPVSPETNREYPSFVRDYIIGSIDLNRILIKNVPTTFITVADGDSMIEDCIDSGDLLIIDKSLDPYDGCLAACYIDGNFTLKKVRIEKDYAWLIPANPVYEPIKVTEDNDFIIWGIVTSIIKLYRKNNDRAG